MPPRSTTTDRGLPTVDQAVRILKERYAQFDVDEVFTGYKSGNVSISIEQLYQEAQGMARGKGMAPDVVGPPNLPPSEVVEVAGKPGLLQSVGKFATSAGEFATKLGQTITPGGERGFLGPKEAVADTSAGPSGKRVITQDQADYLKASGRWDPSRYEIR